MMAMQSEAVFLDPLNCREKSKSGKIRYRSSEDDEGRVLQAGQTIDDIYKGRLPLLGLNVEIDVQSDRATPVNSICPDDIFPWRYGK